MVAVSLALLGFFFVFAIYMLIRNEIVYHFRMRVIDRCAKYGSIAPYYSMPDYNVMLWHLLTWPTMKRYLSKEDCEKLQKAPA